MNTEQRYFNHPIYSKIPKTERETIAVRLAYIVGGESDNVANTMTPESNNIAAAFLPVQEYIFNTIEEKGSITITLREIFDILVTSSPIFKSLERTRRKREVNGQKISTLEHIYVVTRAYMGGEKFVLTSIQEAIEFLKEVIPPLHHDKGKSEIANDLTEPDPDYDKIVGDDLTTVHARKSAQFAARAMKYSGLYTSDEIRRWNTAIALHHGVEMVDKEYLKVDELISLLGDAVGEFIKLVIADTAGALGAEKFAYINILLVRDVYMKYQAISETPELAPTFFREYSKELLALITILTERLMGYAKHVLQKFLEDLKQSLESFAHNLQPQALFNFISDKLLELEKQLGGTELKTL